MEVKHIYVHIPFCLKKCKYCDFTSIALNDDLFLREDLLDKYLKRLLFEIESRFRIFGKPESAVETIYFGGGTPTMLGNARLLSVIQKIKEFCVLDGECEITVETNPSVFNLEDYKKCLDAGFNRISIGVQSFSDEVLKVIGRTHDKRSADDAVQMASDAGFKNISIDLMLGIPQAEGQKFNLVDFSNVPFDKITHISAYQFGLCDNTPIKNDILSGRLLIAGEDEMAAEYIRFCEFMRQKGFLQYEISNFAKNENYISRHNFSYWLLKNYMGFGTSAVSTDNFKRRTNCKDIFKYLNEDMGSEVCHEIETLTQAEKDEEALILPLRTYLGIGVENIGTEKCGGIENKLKNFFELLDKNKLAVYNKGQFLKLTPSGYMVMNEIAAKILAAL